MSTYLLIVIVILFDRTIIGVIIVLIRDLIRLNSTAVRFIVRSSLTHGSPSRYTILSCAQ